MNEIIHPQWNFMVIIYYSIQLNSKEIDFTFKILSGAWK